MLRACFVNSIGFHPKRSVRATAAGKVNVAKRVSSVQDMSFRAPGIMYVIAICDRKPRCQLSNAALATTDMSADSENNSSFSEGSSSQS